MPRHAAETALAAAPGGRPRESPPSTRFGCLQGSVLGKSGFFHITDETSNNPSSTGPEFRPHFIFYSIWWRIVGFTYWRRKKKRPIITYTIIWGSRRPCLIAEDSRRRGTIMVDFWEL